MGLIRLQKVSKQFGGQVVLRDVSLDLHTNETAALVGANGVGKTTLFKLITGALKPDFGTVTRSKGLEVGYLSQEPDVPAGLTLRAAVGEAFAELMALERRLQALSEQMAHESEGPELTAHMEEYDRVRARFEAAGGYGYEQRIDEVLGGLGFSPRDYELPIGVLSGGQKCRAALAKLLLQERQLLLLDEPTNHLDIDAVRWLEKFLAGHHGGAVIISHDRYLLDRLAQRTIEVAGGGVQSYPGNYSRFVEVRALRQLSAERQYEQDRKFIQKEQEFIARHIAGQRTKEAQGRRTRLERRMADGEFQLERPTDSTAAARIEFGDLERNVQRGKEVVRVEGVSKQYDDKRLFHDLSLSVFAGQRIGITGPNGTGKTTLLRIILDQVAPDAGRVEVSAVARVGYFEQEPTRLNPDHSIVQELISIRGDWLERDARNFAARFLFCGEDPFKQVSTLSGGEQSRVRFMKLILTNPDVLILDEPTNHLDIPSREALEAALSEFPGTVITVSHDRYFLDRIVEKLLVMRLDGHQLHQGNYSFYIEEVERARNTQEADEAAARKPRRRGGVRPARHASGGQPASRFAKMKLEQLETLISEREGRLSELERQFGAPEVYRDAERITALRAEFDELKAELSEAEAEWLRRAEQE